MKKVIDIEKAMLTMFLINKAFKSKFKRNWGTTTVDGIEVFNERVYYYNMYNPGLTKSTSVQKILKTLGIDKTINEAAGSYQGVESAWLYLNASKATNTIVTDLSYSLLANRVEAAYTYAVWYNAIVTINATNIIDNVMPIGVDERRHFDAQAAETWLLANYGGLINNSVQSSIELNNSDDAFTNDVLVKYVLLDKTAEVFDIEITGVSINGTPTASGVVNSVSIELRFRRNTPMVNENSTYLAVIKPILEQPNTLRDRSLIYNNNRFGSTEASGAVTNELFYEGKLRVSTTQLERSEFSKLIRMCIDIDYKKYVKKRKWYQKLLAIVIFVIIVWVTWGWGTALAGEGALAATSMAYGLTAVSLGLTLATFVAGKLGYGDLVGFYGKFIRITSFASMVIGVGAAIQTIASKGILETIKAKIAGMATGLSSFSSEMMMKSMSYVMQLTNMVMGNQLKKIDNANNSMTEKIKDQEAQLYDMYDKEFNLPLEALTWHNSPLKVDDMQFEIDYLYEPTKTNICRRSFF